jgi:hypothetical protein
MVSPTTTMMTRIAAAVLAVMACGKPPQPPAGEGEGPPPPPPPRLAASDAAVASAPIDAQPAPDARPLVDAGPPEFEIERYPPEIRKAFGGLDGEHRQDWAPGVQWMIDHPDESRPAIRAYLLSEPGIMGEPRALLALAEISHPDDVPFLVERAHRRPRHLNDYIGALQTHRHDSALEALIALTTDPAEAIVNSAVGSLGGRKDERGRPALEAALDHASADVRGSAAWALNRMGPRKSRAALQRRLKIEKDPDVRAELRRALRK